MENHFELHIRSVGYGIQEVSGSIPPVSAKILGFFGTQEDRYYGKIKFVVSATIEETFSDFIISKK